MSIPQVLPQWRSLLFCPANSERFIAKAHTRCADAVILDLEDSVPGDQKNHARASLAESVRLLSRGSGDICVRVNRPLELAVIDIAAAVQQNVYALVLPKVAGPEHIALLSEVVDSCEAAAGMPMGATRFVAIVESASVLGKMEAIARSSPRMVALGVGGEDLATDLGAEPVPDALYVPKMLGVIAARAAGILPLGVLGSVGNLSDHDAYSQMVRRSRAVGLSCATCVHPGQVPILNDIFAASADQLDRARRLMTAYEEAVSRGEGSARFEGRMVDLPVVNRARRLIAQSQR